MFREGQYHEIIKVSENYSATAIVTVKEKKVEIESKKIFTNKWLTLEDWSALYRIIQKAILKSSGVSYGANGSKNSEHKKSTRRLDIIYTFEIGDESSLPTIQVRVCPAKKRPRVEKSNETNISKVESSIKNCDNTKSQKKRSIKVANSSWPEEYVPPDLPNRTEPDVNLKYVPSKKSFLKKIHRSRTSNLDEYTPTSKTEPENGSVYQPNAISKLGKKRKHEMYEPYGFPSDISESYVPSSKGSSTIIEEYKPDFATSEVVFDESYVPSSKINQENLRNNTICDH